MRPFTHALAVLYGLTAVALLRCAMVSHQHGAPVHTAFFAGAAVLLATAIAHHAYHRDELRHAQRVNASLRHPSAAGRTSMEDGVVAVALAAACCETWWATAGADHDPDTCTRKDHHA